jgi:alpha-galactosidase
MDPLGFWRANDTEDRQGITEIRHVEGYLAYWDALIAKHPGMLLDTCASGGRRDDLETLRRSVPLHRSDYILEPTGVQCHSWGLPLWVPFSGAGAKEIDPYIFRSNMHPAIVENCDLRDRGLNYDLLRKLVGEWRLVSRYYYEDYYPLTPYSQAEDVWMAWQFHARELGEGFIQAFRRPSSPYFGLQIRLRGLDRGATYELRSLDKTETVTMTGEALLSRGLPVSIDERPGAAVIVYKRVPEK